jgi:ATP-binding cassette subfamily B multidrug efflux pump
MKKIKIHIIKTLSHSIRQYKKDTVLSIIFVSFEAVMECIIPLIMSYLIDEMNKGTLTNLFYIYAGVLVVMALLSLFFGAMAGKFCARASSGFATNLRGDLYRNIQAFSFSNIDKFSSSSLVTRLTTDVSNVQNAFMMLIRTAIRAPFMMIFSIIMSFVISPKLAWIFVVVVPLLLGALMLIIYFAFPIFKRIFKQYDKLNESVEENISGIRAVKSFVREDYEVEKFNKSSSEIKKGLLKAEHILAWNQPAMQFAIYTINLLVIFLGASIIIKTGSYTNGEYIFGELTPGGLSSLTVYGMQTLMSLMMLSMIVVMITMSVESADRINEVLSEKSNLTNPAKPIYSLKNGDVEFKDVSFKYNVSADLNALSGINLKIKSGQTIGILGDTGSSKSTLVNLIPRLYDVTEGELLVGGVNVKKYDLDTLRNGISVVLQKNVLFSGTIKENLRWGNPNATDEEIIHACKLAQADEFISSFKDGYDTHIEQGGNNVSGGQKQRLCIARALLKRPKILILDDSTSAVDTKTDALIRQAFAKEIPDVTKIIIAQRVASVKDCDQIVILKNGFLDHVGTHEFLYKNVKTYKDTYDAQNRVTDNKEVK